MGQDLSAYLRVICVTTTASRAGQAALGGRRVMAVHAGNEGLIHQREPRGTETGMMRPSILRFTSAANRGSQNPTFAVDIHNQEWRLMKRSGCERSAFTPTSGHHAGSHPNTAQANHKPEPGADDTCPPEQHAGAGQTPAATIPPMPFPGPFAYTPLPAVAGQDGAHTGAVTSTSTSAREPRENPHGLMPLIAAARRGDLSEINSLIQSRGIDVNQSDGKYGVSALMVAAHQGHAEVVAALLAAKADVNFVNARLGITALMLAAHRGHVEVVRILLNHPGINVDQPNGAGDTALMCAALNDKPDVVACLLAAGAQVNLANARNVSTALLCAARSGHVEVVRMLLKHQDINVDQPDRAGNTALMHAAWNSKPDVVACLLAAGARVNLANAGIGASALLCAAHSGRVEVIRLLLKHPEIAVDQPSDAGNTALMHAAWNNKPDVMACLLAAGAQVNLAHDKTGATALSGAAGLGHVEVVRMLLAHPGIAVDQPDDDGDTALMWAACSDKPDVVACLLAAGASMNLVNRNGDTALASAIKQGHAALIEVFLLHGAQLDGEHLDGFLPVPDTETIASMDLCAERDRPAPSPLAPAQAGGKMSDALINVCLAMSGVDYTVDADALKARLVQDGWCAPTAQLIALSWRDALAALHEKPIAIPDGLTLGQAAQFLRKQTAVQAPTLFALEIERQLESRERLTVLRAMLGSSNDEGLQALFQRQCDQLRQHCVQLLEEGKSNAPQALNAVQSMQSFSNDHNS